MSIPTYAESFNAANRNPTDFKLSVGDHTWHVHSSLLTEKSLVFRCMIGSGFKESVDKHIILQEDNPEDVARLLLGLYYKTYTYGNDRPIGSDGPSISDMMQASRHPGAKLDQVNLRESRAQFLGNFEDYLDTDLRMFVLADKYDVPDIITQSLTDIQFNILAESVLVWKVFDFMQSTNMQRDDLLSSMIDIIVANIDHYRDEPLFEKTFKDNSKLSWMLARKLSARLSLDQTQTNADIETPKQGKLLAKNNK